MAGDKRALQPGTLIHNRYRVERVLGAGGFGVTYMVTDTRENCIAAMKEYMPMDIAYRPAGSKEVRPLTSENKTFYEKFRKQFLDEAQTIYEFDGHPNIIQVRHLFYENNTAYYVMEFVTGMDLSKYLKSQGSKMTWPMLRPIVAQVVSALKRVHERGKIHCDISPDNIFLLNNGQVKLLDFGAARSTLRGEVETSVIVAKPAFAPYEQMKGVNMGPWTDVYSLAVTIYSCITGSLPPKSEERIIKDNTIWPSQMGVAIPSAAWERALQRAMALRREDRYQSVLEFWNDLSAGDMPHPAYSARVEQHSAPSRPVPPAQEPTEPTYIPAQARGHRNSAPVLILEGTQGILAGRRIPVQRELILGVDAARCNLVMPQGTPGISRRHLRIWPVNGCIQVMDLGSTYGTWLNGKKMTPGLVYPMAQGSVLFMGKNEVFRAL